MSKRLSHDSRNRLWADGMQTTRASNPIFYSALGQAIELSDGWSQAAGAALYFSCWISTISHQRLGGRQGDFGGFAR
jgi:hypothetical protein